MKIRILILMLAFCSLPQVVAAQAAGPSPAIGIAVPTSGQYAPLGKQLVEAAQMAANETGVRVVVADTKGEPAAAVAAIAKLAADPNIAAIVGPVGQRESRAAASAAQRAGVPLFTLATANSVNRAGGWVFRVRLSPAEQATSLAVHARKTLDLKRVAILYPQTAYGESAALAFAEAFIDEGGEVRAVANYREDTSDFRDVLDVVVAKKVYLGKKGTVDRWRTDASGFARLGSEPKVDFDALFVPDFHDRVARLLSFLPLAGIQNGNAGEGIAVQLLGLAGWQGKTMELAGGLAAGALYVDTFAGASAGGRAEEFGRTFEQHTGRKPVDIEAETFDMVWLLGQIVPDAAKASKGKVSAMRAEVVRRLPRREHWTGAAGPVKFGTAGEPIRKLAIYRFDADGLVSPAY